MLWQVRNNWKSKATSVGRLVGKDHYAYKVSAMHSEVKCQLQKTKCVQTPQNIEPETLWGSSKQCTAEVWFGLCLGNCLEVSQMQKILEGIWCGYLNIREGKKMFLKECK